MLRVSGIYGFTYEYMIGNAMAMGKYMVDENADMMTDEQNALILNRI